MFYPETGRLTQLITYANEGCTKRSGPAAFWYDDGTRVYSGSFDGQMRVGIWVEGSDSGLYVSNKREGLWVLGHGRNGTERGAYKNGLREGLWTAKDSLGRAVLQYNFLAGKKDGEWLRTDPLSNEVERRVYRADSLILGKADPVVHSEHMPYIKACVEHSTDKARAACTDSIITVHLRNNLRYPKEAQEMMVTGKASIAFVVAKDGSIQDLKARSGLCGAIERECIRVLSNMPAWEPGVQNDKAVTVQYHQPIKFSLK